jgi:LacI family transcriptional regulator
VVTDDVGGAQLAVEHLLGHGHAYVACFGGPVASPAPGDPVIDHIEGWRRAMTAAGVATEGRLIDAPFDRYGARAVAVELLRSPDRPPAIFCSTDDQAIGVARAAREVGVRIPEDLALAGFDDIPEAAFCDPPLTTIASDRDAMAKAAVDLVLDDSLLVPGSDTPRVRRFPSRLVTRRSCGCS